MIGSFSYMAENIVEKGTVFSPFHTMLTKHPLLTLYQMTKS